MTADYRKINNFHKSRELAEKTEIRFEYPEERKIMYNGRIAHRMGKTALFCIPLIIVFYALLVFDRKSRTVNLEKTEMTVGFYTKFGKKEPKMPDEVWGTSLKEYSSFPEIINLLGKHYVPTCEAVCKGHSTETLNLIRQGECLHLWPYVWVLDSETDIYTENNSTASLPCFITLGTSTIKNAGRGIFTKIDLPPGLLFGPYTGFVVSKASDISAYAWQIYYKNNSGKYFYMDGAKPESSNWMRYINTARYEEEQNMFAFPADEAIYYMTYKRVPANSELLTWYGPNYAKSLGFQFKAGKDEVYPLIAPYFRDRISASPEIEQSKEEE